MGRVGRASDKPALCQLLRRRSIMSGVISNPSTRQSAPRVFPAHQSRTKAYAIGHLSARRAPARRVEPPILNPEPSRDN